MLLSFRTPRLRAHRRTLSITQVSRLAARAQLAVLGAFLVFFGYVIYVYWHALAVGGNPLAAIQRDSYAYAPHGRPYCAWRRWQRERFSGLAGTNKTVFIAANFRNSEAVLPTFIQELPSLLAFLGPKNVYVSVYENGSNDKTRALLNLLAEALHVIGTPHTISSNDGGPESQKISGHRVAVLTGVRNKVLAPLYSSAPGTYDEVIFMNDVYHCATDVLELLYQKRAQGANQVCATDWDDYLVFDRWPLRAMSGQPFYRYEDLTNYFNTPSRDGPVPLILPHASDESDRARFTNNAPLQVFSCWNGMTAIDAAPFTSAEGPLRFRMSRADIDDQGRHRSNSEKASEAFLLDVDLWKKHMGRIALIPKASVAYSLRTYNRHRKDKLQPLATANEKIAWADRPPARLAMQDFGVWDEPERWARWDEQ